jgi:hypothetical protein
MQFPLLPPVNPIARNTIIKNVIEASPLLYTDQTYETTNSVLGKPSTEGTNELVYSGGETKMMNIPLQYNYPYNEQLRSQNVLVTPYNNVKYCI